MKSIGKPKKKGKTAVQETAKQDRVWIGEKDLQLLGEVEAAMKPARRKREAAFSG